jgi:3-oxoadipate enol-lactonase
MQVFADDGARIEVRAAGDAAADAIVLIHGFPLSHEIWQAQVEALSRAYRVLAPDLRGMGASSVTDGPYLMDALAADVAALLDALEIERAAIAGHSAGGYVALAFARMFTERVTHLGLVCSRLSADSADQAAARRALADRIEREGDVEPAVEAYVPRLFAPWTPQRDAGIVERVYAIARKTDPRGAAALLRGMALRVCADDVAADLPVPAAVIAGGSDAIVPLEESETIASAFPRGRLAVCERSGHLAMLEEPERVTAALEALLADHG